MPLDRIQPSQLYIGAHKLARVRRWYDPLQPETLAPLPVVRLCGKTVYTDGHTRACVAFLAGQKEAPVYWDEDELDWAAYKICVRWCERAGLYSIAGLVERVVGPEAYQELWLHRCARIHRWLEMIRRSHGRTRAREDDPGWRHTGPRAAL